MQKLYNLMTLTAYSLAVPVTLLAGWLISGKTVSTKHGEAMEFITFEDETALVETIFFPQTYRKHCHLLASGRPYLLQGQVEEDYGAVTLTVSGLKPITWYGYDRV